MASTASTRRSSIPGGPGQFNFNQYLIVDDAPLLFHTGPRRMFPLVREAMAHVMPVEQLRYVAFSHFEADECGALNEWLAVAPRAETVCGQIAAMVSANDVGDRPARALADGEVLTLGKHAVRWFDTPHLPHGWDAGLMMETSTRTFLCGDLFTQGGSGRDSAYRIRHPRSRARRFAGRWITTRMRLIRAAILERLAREQPTTLACMHGSAFRGDGAALLRALARSLSARPQLRAAA